MIVDPPIFSPERRTGRRREDGRFAHHRIYPTLGKAALAAVPLRADAACDALYIADLIAGNR